MSRTPPFRADMVGSLLRTAPLREARAKRQKGEISAAALAEVEDREIEKVVKRQEEIGFPLATDGEFRRSRWHYDFFWNLAGVERATRERGSNFHGVMSRPEGAFVSGRLDFPADHPMLAHFRFLKAHAVAVPKMCIPSPSVLHFRRGRAGVSHDAYPDMGSFFIDLAHAYHKVVQAFYDAGCRYLQFDDTVWAHLCSESERKAARERGEQPDLLPKMYARVINHMLADKPADMVVTTHSCHGNFRSSWLSEGGYEPIAELLLGDVDYDGYFLEYDSTRTGGFEPLRFLPKGKKKVVLGLVSTKTGALENEDLIKRRIEDATRYVDIDQLCLSPQCGFASTEEGNILAEHEQWAKLRMVVAVAGDMWGRH
jgi:5-methyltetrahydropteroyltriglutamate--homocysteine methyltransferase